LIDKSEVAVKFADKRNPFLGSEIALTSVGFAGLRDELATPIQITPDLSSSPEAKEIKELAGDGDLLVGKIY
jgi:hypothetical protein